MFQITGLVTNLAQRSHHRHCFAIWPFFRVDRSNIGGHRPSDLRHDSAMAGIKLFKAGQIGMSPFRESGADIVQQAGLVSFDHQQIVATLGHDLSGNLLLQPMAHFVPPKDDSRTDFSWFKIREHNSMNVMDYFDM